MKKNIILLLAFASFGTGYSQLSKAWVSDLGNGKYKNPIVYADYSDPDLCRVGDDYYMTASSFNCIPGLPILHSKDLVNWTLVGHALQKQLPDTAFSKPSHGNGVWAPSIRFRNGEYYIYYGDPDYGIYMVKTKNPKGVWEEPVLVKPGKGLIDACPFWDEDGKAYIAHALAGSRAGVKSVICVTEMTPDGTKAIGESRIVFDGHEGHETIEGAKVYKRNGWYYIFAPAGGVKPGWQVALRSKNIWGPYEIKTVLAQGKTNINGPHQGGWVDTPDGKEDWFIHFQDQYAYGRVVLLQPMQWINDWPVMGIDKDKDGCGDPVSEYKKPNVGKTYPKATPADSDEFEDISLGLQWQWQANYSPWWYFCDATNSKIKLYSHHTPKAKNFMERPNLMLQKFPADKFTATTKVKLVPDKRKKGETGGLIVMGLDYAYIEIENGENGYILRQSECIKADKKKPEVENITIPLKQNDLYLRVKVTENAMCQFSYSLDGKKFTNFGKPFKAREGQWIGAKVGLYCNRPAASNDGGWLEADWFRIDQ